VHGVHPLFDPRVKGPHFPGVVYVGMALQVGVVGLLIAAITRRLYRPGR
jgi:hypothetical protein